MGRVPREVFLPEAARAAAYYDSPLGIGEGQTISAPHMVGIMLEALDLREGQRVLEVGGGSGYHAALVAELVGPKGAVYSVERLESLGDRARRSLEEAGYRDRVTVIVGDGSLGWPPMAPYDRIFVSCGAPQVPPPLLDQLGPEGVLLIPVGSRYAQRLMRLEFVKGRLRERDFGGCVFVPLVGEFGYRG
jgi:protein-L-isoaspartate(D-aspartate) O-methyltransferase